MLREGDFRKSAEALRRLGVPREHIQLLEEAATKAAETSRLMAEGRPGGQRDRSPEIGELAAALAKAQGEMTHAAKDRENDQLRSRYATLASVIDACREPLSKHGLAIIQRAHEISYLSDVEGRVTVTTLLTHSSGQWVLDTLTVPMERVVSKMGNKQTWIQAVGSAFTYARRYALAAIVGVAAGDEEDDDDGSDWAGERPRSNLAQARDQAAAQASQRTAQQPPVKPPPVMPIGKLKGKPLAQVGDDDLTMAIEELKQKLEKEPNAEWAPAARKGIDAMGEELERRITAAQGKKG